MEDARDAWPRGGLAARPRGGLLECTHAASLLLPCEASGSSLRFLSCVTACDLQSYHDVRTSALQVGAPTAGFEPVAAEDNKIEPATALANAGNWHWQHFLSIMLLLLPTPRSRHGNRTAVETSIKSRSAAMTNVVIRTSI